MANNFHSTLESELPAAISRRLRYQIQGYLHQSPVGLYRAASLFPGVTNAVVTIGYVDRTAVIDKASITIEDFINEQPNTCTFKTRMLPSVGQNVQIGLGSVDVANLLFAGTITTIEQGYDISPVGTFNIVWTVHCVDYTFLLNRRRPYGQFVAVAADQVLVYLIQTFAPSFNTVGIPTGLAPISITLDGNDTMAKAITDICNLIGYHWRPDYAFGIRVFISETGTAPTAIDINNTTTQVNPGFTYDIDLSQIRTRVTGRGASLGLLSDIVSGETILPVSSIDIFPSTGGNVYVGPLQATFTGVQSSVDVSFVGPGAAPLTPLNSFATIGTGMSLGSFKFAYTFVVGAGESLPSPLAIVSTVFMSDPTIAPVAGAATGTTYYTAGDLVAGDSVRFAYSYGASGTPTDTSIESGLSPASNAVIIQHNPTFPALLDQPYVTVYGAPAPCLYIHYWRSVNGGAWLSALMNGTGSVQTYSTNPGSGVPVFNTDYASGGTGTVAPNQTFQQLAVYAIPAGPSGTTARKIYRTAVGGTQLKLDHTFADNTTTSYTCSSADGTLGANAPTADTSGLTQPTGNVLKGSTTLLLSSAGPFFSTGGWALVNGAYVRYTGISTNTLTGIPTEGPGSLSVSASYGTAVKSVPSLTGVAGITTLFNNATIAFDAASSSGAATSGTSLSWSHVFSGANRVAAIQAFSVGDKVTGITVGGVAATLVNKQLSGAGANYTYLYILVAPTAGTQTIVVTYSSSSSYNVGSCVSYTGAKQTGQPDSSSVHTSTSTTLNGGILSSISGSILVVGGTCDSGLPTATTFPHQRMNVVPGSFMFDTDPLVPAGTYTYVSTFVSASNWGSVAATFIPAALAAYTAGTPVGLRVTTDDTAAQAVVAALEGGDGIVEYQFTDTSITTMQQLSAAVASQLALFKSVTISVTESARDTNTNSGKLLSITLPSPINITASLLIQSVTITHIDTEINSLPLYTAKASSVKYTLQDFMRQLGGLLTP